jgi:hypothetical protein
MNKVNEICGRFKWIVVACNGKCGLREAEQIQSLTK